ncbi:hypothetical protein EYF80_002239 [Liparis tanakae]|uniref:Uncharacterized protein n=1 Tax=Liparis tanakae TaxID=230148 RepID=A0A4Z2JE57_9TELE|nr:hypothetical protein EYF80_002239 [Liparis tanakae]
MSALGRTDLAGVVVDDEALVPAVEVFVGVDLDPELLQHGLVGSLAHGVHVTHFPEKEMALEAADSLRLGMLQTTAVAPLMGREGMTHRLVLPSVSRVNSAGEVSYEQHAAVKVHGNVVACFFESDISQVQDSGHNLKHHGAVHGRDADHIHGMLGKAKGKCHVVHDGVLIDLAEQHHVVHSAEFDIVALPVVPVVPPAPLQQNTHNVQLLVHCEGHNETVWTNRESDIKVTLTHGYVNE